MSGAELHRRSVQAAARAKIDAYFGEELNRRRGIREEGSELADDVLTSLLGATHEGRGFTNAQLLPLILLLLVGGNETTTSLIGNLVWRLLDLGLWHAVAATPGCVTRHRGEPAVRPSGARAVSHQHPPVALCGVELEAGSKVQGCTRPPTGTRRHGTDPDTFRLDRELDELKRGHLSFGLGQYLCPGAAWPGWRRGWRWTR